MEYLFVFYAAILFAPFLNASTNSEAQVQAVLSELKQSYGIVVHQLVETGQLPRSVVFKINNGEAVVQLTQMEKGQYLNYLKILKNALQKYPPSLIEKHIKDIYISGPYQENGGVITGMYERDKIYLFYNHKAGDNTPLFLEQTFHHEFSSILIQQYNFPAFDWLKLNPENFSYIINSEKIDEYMNSIDSYSADESMLRQGLVSAYGKVNAENDINTYVEQVFSQPEKMKSYIANYPIAAKKYKMIKQFYLSISPQFQQVFSLIDK